MDLQEKTELKTATINIGNDNILRVKFRNEIVMELPDARKHEEVINEMCQGVKRGFIIDARDVFITVTPEARTYMAKSKKVNKVRKALAILVNSLPSRMISEFYIKFNKPECPAKSFEDEKEAIKWLNSFN